MSVDAKHKDNIDFRQFFGKDIAENQVVTSPSKELSDLINKTIRSRDKISSDHDLSATAFNDHDSLIGGSKQRLYEANSASDYTVDSPYSDDFYDFEDESPTVNRKFRTLGSICHQVISEAVNNEPSLEPHQTPCLSVKWLNDSLPLVNHNKIPYINSPRPPYSESLSSLIGDYFNDLAMYDFRCVVKHLLNRCNISYRLAHKRLIRSSVLAKVLDECGIQPRSELMTIITNNIVWFEGEFISLGKLVRLAGELPTNSSARKYVDSIYDNAVKSFNDEQKCQNELNESLLRGVNLRNKFDKTWLSSDKIYDDIVKPKMISKTIMTYLDHVFEMNQTNDFTDVQFIVAIKRLVGLKDAKHITTLVTEHSEMDKSLREIRYADLLSAVIKDLQLEVNTDETLSDVNETAKVRTTRSTYSTVISEGSVTSGVNSDHTSSKGCLSPDKETLSSVTLNEQLKVAKNNVTLPSNSVTTSLLLSDESSIVDIKKHDSLDSELAILTAKNIKKISAIVSSDKLFLVQLQTWARTLISSIDAHMYDDPLKIIDKTKLKCLVYTICLGHLSVVLIKDILSALNIKVTSELQYYIDELERNGNFMYESFYLSVCSLLSAYIS